MIWTCPCSTRRAAITRALLGGWQLFHDQRGAKRVPRRSRLWARHTATGVTRARAAWRARTQPGRIGPDLPEVVQHGGVHRARAGDLGDSPRTGAIRLPGVFSIDLSVNKSFRFSETRRAELRTEFLQLPNHYNIDPVRWIAGSAR